MPSSFELSKPLKYSIVFGVGVGISAAIAYKVFKYQRRRSSSQHRLMNYEDIHAKKRAVPSVIIEGPIDGPMTVIEESSANEIRNNNVNTEHILEEDNQENVESSLEENSLLEEFLSSQREPVETDSVDDGFNEHKINRKVLLLGLEHSGKSSLLSQLSREGNSCMEYEPTKGFNVVCISFENVDISIWEIGGGEQYRTYWKNFCSATNLLLFVVDSTTPEKFPQARKYFSEIIEDLPDGIDFRIIATKSDQPNSVPVEVIRDALGLNGMEWDILNVATKSGGAMENIGIDEIQNYCLNA